jgi:hypothetical protein
MSHRGSGMEFTPSIFSTIARRSAASEETSERVSGWLTPAPPPKSSATHRPNTSLRSEHGHGGRVQVDAASASVRLRAFAEGGFCGCKYGDKP